MPHITPTPSTRQPFKLQDISMHAVDQVSFEHNNKTAAYSSHTMPTHEATQGRYKWSSHSTTHNSITHHHTIPFLVQVKCAKHWSCMSSHTTAQHIYQTNTWNHQGQAHQEHQYSITHQQYLTCSHAFGKMKFVSAVAPVSF